MTKIEGVLMDPESIRGNSSGDSWIHTVCLIPFTMQTGKLSSYVLHTSRGIVIKFNDVINNELVKHHLFQSDGVTHVNNKHGNDVLACAQYGIKITRHMKFYDGMKFAFKYIKENGNLIMSHNLIGDLKFFVSTQNLVGGKRLFKNKLAEFPDTGSYDKNWEDLAKVCTMSLFCNRCPHMKEEYQNWAKKNNRNNKMNTLESLIQFVKDDRGYLEKHAAVQDTVDLFTVLKYAYKCDGPILDGYSYFAEPSWTKAV